VGAAQGRSGREGWTGCDLIEVALAAAAFAVLCVVALRTATFMPGPDDHAFKPRSSAMTEGHFLTLSDAQVNALAAQLRRPDARADRMLRLHLRPAR
jgi:hypothetical protein